MSSDKEKVRSEVENMWIKAVAANLRNYIGIFP
jgi:hypothetical protein